MKTFYFNGVGMSILSKKKKRKMMSQYSKDKLESIYRYSMPLHWVLDKMEDGKYNEITKFDIYNAKHSLDVIESCRFPPEESDN